MIGVNSNIFVYAHRRDLPQFGAASRRLRALTEGDEPWLIPRPCVHEFLAVVTDTRLFKSASTIDRALRQVEYWLESPSLRVTGEGGGHWPLLREAVRGGGSAGGAVHDARIAAICREHGVGVLWSADRDLSRFPGLRVENPLDGGWSTLARIRQGFRSFAHAPSRAGGTPGA